MFLFMQQTNFDNARVDKKLKIQANKISDYKNQ